MQQSSRVFFLFACLKACFRLSLSTRNKKKRTITSKKHAYRPETSYVLYYSLKNNRCSVRFAMFLFERSTCFSRRVTSANKCETCDRSVFSRVKLTDEVAASDLRPITSGDTSSSLAEFGAGEVTPHPDLAGERGKRSARTPVKQTPNARPRARARTEEWSDLQSGRLHDVSEGNSAVTSGQPSETSSSFIRRTQSGRVPNVASNSGERAIVRRNGPPPVYGLAQCGSTALWEMNGEGPGEDCGGGVFHTGEEFLCTACYRTSNRWKHMGPNLLDDAIAWAKECRAAGAGLPRAVVKSFVPLEACLCPSDRF